MKYLTYTLLVITMPLFATAQKLEAGINGGINLPLREYEDPGFYSRLSLHLHTRSFYFGAGVEGGRIAYTQPADPMIIPQGKITSAISPYFLPHLAANYKARFRDAYGYAGVMSGYMLGTAKDYTSFKEKYDAFIIGAQAGTVIGLTEKLGLNIELGTRWGRYYGAWIKHWPASVGLRYAIK